MILLNVKGTLMCALYLYIRCGVTVVYPEHWACYVLSSASEVGSPTNPPWALDSDKARGQGSFGPFTGELAITTYKKI